MTRDDFDRMKQSALEQALKTHNSRTVMPPVPDFVRIPEGKKQNSTEFHNPPILEEKKSEETNVPQKKSRIASLMNYINIPELLENSDAALLLGLILLLSSEQADEKLILALAYILL